MTNFTEHVHVAATFIVTGTGSNLAQAIGCCDWCFRP